METAAAYVRNVPATDQAKSEGYPQPDGVSRHRPIQLPRCRDFFVPISQKERPPEGDSPGIASASVEKKPRKKRCRLRKRPLDDVVEVDSVQIATPSDLERSFSRDDSGASDQTTFVAPEDRKVDLDHSSRVLAEDTPELVGAVLHDRRGHLTEIADQSGSYDVRCFRKIDTEKGGRHASAFQEAGEPTSTACCPGAIADKSAVNSAIPREVEYHGGSCGGSAKAMLGSRSKCKNVFRGPRIARSSNSPEVGERATETTIEDLNDSEAGAEQQEKSVHLHSETAGVDTIREKALAKISEGLPGKGILMTTRRVSKTEFFVPTSKRRKPNEQLEEASACEAKNNRSKARWSRDGEAAPRLERDEMAVGGAAENDILTSMVEIEAASLPESRAQNSLRYEAILAAAENARLNVGKEMHPFFSVKMPSASKIALQYKESEKLEFSFEDFQLGDAIHVNQSGATNDCEKALQVHKVANVTFMGSKESAFRSTESHMLNRIHFDGPTRLLQPLLFRKSADRARWRNCHANSVSSSALIESSAVGNIHTVDGMVNVASNLESLLRRFMSTQARTNDLKSSETAALTDTHDLHDGAKNAGLNISLDHLNKKLSWYMGRHDGRNIPYTYSPTVANGKTVHASSNLLWTDLYQPNTSKEVCGNADAVERLRSWLLHWQERIGGNSTNQKANQEKSSAWSDSDGDWFEDSVDSEKESHEDVGNSNTLLICGPEGCGKSAAIYACAAEQGFEVIEVNTSDHRPGSLVKSKYGEAMKSHTLRKRRQPGANSSQSVRGEGHRGQGLESKQTTLKWPSNRRKQIADCRGDSSPAQSPSPEKETAVDFQTTGRTLILFEDVDRHFNDEKGLLSALAELANKTMRPIILTSNRRNPPGMLPVLEKCRIDFSHPASNELIVHSTLVCLAERVPCRTAVVESLVHSCGMDLRKVMMALQFWGQGNEPSTRTVISDNAGESAGRSGSSGELEHENSASQEKGPFVQAPNYASGMCDYVKTPLNYLSRCVRWLFELDIHHLLLPKIVMDNAACPLSTCIAKKIQTAVRELEIDTAEVVARRAQQRASKRETKLEDSDLFMKVIGKKRRVVRAATPSNATPSKAMPSRAHSLEDSPSPFYIIPSVEEKVEASGTTSSSTPSTGIRAARAIARSRDRRTALKSRRAIFQDETEYEQPEKPQPAERIDSRDRTVADAEAGLPLARQASSHPQENVAEHSEKIHLAELGSTAAEDARTLSTSQVEVSEVRGTVTNDKRLAEIFSTSHPVVSIDKSEITAGGDVSTLFDDERPYKCVPEVERQPEHPKNESGTPVEHISSSREISIDPNELTLDSSGTLRFHSGAAQSLTCSILSGKKSFCTGKQNAEQLDQSARKNIGCESEPQVFDNGTRSLDMTDPLQSRASIKCNTIEDSTFTSRAEDEHCREDFTCAKTSGHEAKSANPVNEADPTVIHFGEQVMCHRPNPVSKVWENMRGCQRNELAAIVGDQTRLQVDALRDLADLVDTVSDSDVIATVEIEEDGDSWGRFDTVGFLTFEENLGRFCDWEGCKEEASALVFLRLQQFSSFSQSTENLEGGSILACILESSKDSATVGKCMISKSWQSTNFNQRIGGFDCLFPKRQAEIQARMEDLVKSALRPKITMSSSAFVDYSAHLSRMSQLEEARRAHENVAQGRRKNRFEHYLKSSLQWFSENCVPELLMRTTYRRF